MNTNALALVLISGVLLCQIFGGDALRRLRIVPTAPTGGSSS